MILHIRKFCEPHDAASQPQAPGLPYAFLCMAMAQLPSVMLGPRSPSAWTVPQCT